jgi:hypothetical protein
MVKLSTIKLLGALAATLLPSLTVVADEYNFPTDQLYQTINDDGNNDDGNNDDGNNDDGNDDANKDNNNSGNCAAPNIVLVQESLSASASAIRTDQTISDFYAYDTVAGRSFGGGSALPLSATRSVVAIHQDTYTCELSLVLVHSKPRQGPFYSYAEMYISGDLYKPLIRDDPSFTVFMINDDQYDSLYLRRRGFTLLQWYWPQAETDGMAQPLPSPDWTGCIQLDPRFTNPSMNGQLLGISYAKINEWTFASGDGDEIDLTLDQSLFVCIGDSISPDQGVDQDGIFAYDPFPTKETDSNCDQINYPTCGYCDGDRNPCNWHWWCNAIRLLNCNVGTNIPQP